VIRNIKGKHKGKAVPVFLLTEHHAMKAFWEAGRAPELFETNSQPPPGMKP